MPPKQATPTRRKSNPSLSASAKKRSSTTKKAAAAVAYSQSDYVGYAVCVIASIFVAFGLLDLVKPRQGLTFFELDYPVLAKQQTTIDALIWVIGARDIFMGTALYASMRYGSRHLTGLIMLSASTQAIFDGFVCLLKAGKGQWSHWGYAPMLVAVGTLLVGALDG